MRFHFWNISFSLFFILLSTLGLVWLSGAGKLVAWIPVSDFVLMALAIFRLIRLVSYDTITAFLRDGLSQYHSTTFLGTLGVLVNCPWCTGLWFAFLIAFFYFATPLTWYVILVLALAAVASLLQLTSNLIGWSAEVKKREAQNLSLPR